MIKNCLSGVFCVWLLSFWACSGEGKGGEQSLEDLYFEYTLSAEEDGENVHLLLQFRRGGPVGSSVSLTPPAFVAVDGEKLMGDSTERGGIFYEFQKEAMSFAGNHQVVVANGTGKKYTQHLPFTPFRLSTPFPPVIKRKDIELPLTGWEEGDRVRLVITDTSFASPDINEVVPVKDGSLLITAEQLAKVNSGLLFIEMVKEKEWPIKNGTGKGGKILISQAIKKEAELKD